jgi:hypothetical protein
MSLMSPTARSTFLVEENMRLSQRKTARQFRAALGVFTPDFNVHEARFYRNCGIALGMLDFISFVMWLALLFTTILNRETPYFAETQLLGIHYVVLMLGIVNLTQNLHWSIKEEVDCNVASATVTSVLFGIICAFIDLASACKAFYLTRTYNGLFKAITVVQLATSIIVILWAGASYAWQANHNAYCAATEAKYAKRRKAKGEEAENSIDTSA